MNALKYQIRKAKAADFPAILGMIKELALFEKAPEQVSNTVEQMEEEQALFECFVVENGSGEIVAMALYYWAYYTWVGKSLYLDDLYVKKPYRGQGIATSLIHKIFEVAKAQNCKRVRWQVLEWNKAAIKLYQKLGAEIDGQWCNCDFDQESISSFDSNTPYLTH